MMMVECSAFAATDPAAAAANVRQILPLLWLPALLDPTASTFNSLSSKLTALLPRRLGQVMAAATKTTATATATATATGAGNTSTRSNSSTCSSFPFHAFITTAAVSRVGVVRIKSSSASSGCDSAVPPAAVTIVLWCWMTAQAPSLYSSPTQPLLTSSERTLGDTLAVATCSSWTEEAQGFAVKTLLGLSSTCAPCAAAVVVARRSRLGQ